MYLMKSTKKEKRCWQFNSSSLIDIIQYYNKLKPLILFGYILAIKYLYCLIMKISLSGLFTKIITLLVVISTASLMSCGRSGDLYLVDEKGNKIQQNDDD